VSGRPSTGKLSPLRQWPPFVAIRGRRVVRRHSETDAFDPAPGDQHALPPGVPSGMSVPELIVTVTDKDASRLDLPMCSWKSPGSMAHVPAAVSQ
jgi:hypothetical protein